MDRETLTTSDFGNEFIESENHAENSEYPNPHPRKGKGIRKMYLAAFSCLLMALAMGLISGYSSPATYDMVNRPNSAVKPNDRQVEWITSMVALGLLVGGMVSGPLADKIGRKDTLVFNILPTGLGWLSICYAESVTFILIGRFLGGLSCGTIAVVVPMYCVEISTAEVRGILGSLPHGFLVIGNLLSVTVGAYISWKYLALHGAIVSTATVIFFCFMPETPRWYLMKNDLNNAIRVMKYLQGGFIDAEKECKAIHKDLQSQPKGNVTLEELKHPTSVKPGLITLGVNFLQMYCGMNAVFLYSSSIFVVSEDFMDPKTATIILGAVQVVATILSNVIVDKSGRKILLLISGGLMSLSFTIFGFFYYKTASDVSIQKTYGWIPLACLIVSVIGYSIGYGPIPSLLSAEMLPIRVRGTIGAIVHTCGGIFGFLLLNTFKDMQNLIYNYGTFWFFSCIGLIGMVFVIFCVPETKGKRLEEIQLIFDKQSTKQDISITNMA